MSRWRRIGLGMALVLIVGLTAVVAYLQEFAFLGPWDDEGFFMLALRYVLDGRRLYDEVRVFNGPFYFLAKGLVHGALGVPLTHDGVRLTAITFRLATAATGAWVVRRLARNDLLAVASFYWIGAAQFFVVLEPGHPQELGSLLTVAMPLAASLGARRLSMALWSLGVIVASLLLLKINVGLFAAIAVSVALLSVAEPSRAVRWLRGAAVGTALLVPWVLLRNDLGGWWPLAVVTTSGAIALAQARATNGGPPLRTLARFGLAVAIGAGIAIAAVAAVSGSSLASMIDCIVVFPQQLAAYFSAAPARVAWAPAAAVLGVAASLALGGAARGAGTPWIAAAGQAARLVLGASTLVLGGLPLLGLVPFAWLVLLPGPEGERPWDAQLPRLVLTWAAVLLPLQIFPVPGSQIMVAGLPIVVLGLVCVGDGARWLASFPRAPTRRRLAAAAAAVTLGATAWVATASVRHWRDIWAAGSPAGLLGTERLRIPEGRRQELQALTRELTGCTRVVVLPGMQSLYFWAAQPPPAPTVVDHDTRLLRDGTLQRLEGVLDAAPGACLVRCVRPLQSWSDPRVDALYARATRPRVFGPCTVFDYARAP